ncbi:MAG: hypothetical protein JEZ07_02780 [Phycisphaerae bacterium]|nr:hypothetical protein [Phycisphaerae bacterium]
MKRRKRKNSSSSLFAFQDVMASVIGILFFMVLLMCLSITDQQTAADTQNSEIDNELAAKKEMLEKQLIRLDSEIMSMTKIINAEVQSNQYLEENIIQSNQALDATLKSLNLKIQTLKQLLFQLNKSNNEINDLKVRIASAKNSTARIMDSLEKTREIKTSYIIDDTATEKPILIEIKARMLRVAKVDKLNTVIEFEYIDEDFSNFISWAQAIDKKEYYFVLMKKPSGLAHVNALEKELKKLSFNIGTDLVPEDYDLF